MLLLKSIASSHGTLGGEIPSNLTSSAGSKQVEAWMQISGKKQGERDQRSGSGPTASSQKQIPTVVGWAAGCTWDHHLGKSISTKAICR